MTALTSQKMANSLLWSGIENGTLAVISFGTLIVYSRLLTAPEFGLFSIVLAISELLGVIVSMLFHDALVQRPVVTELHFDTAFTTGCVISVALMSGCWAFASLFSRMVNQPGAGELFAFMGLILPCLAASATIVAQQRRLFAFKSLAIRSLAGRGLGGVVGVGAAFMGAGVWSLALQQIVMAFVGSAVLLFTCSRLPRFRWGLQEFRQLIGFGAFAVSAMFLTFSIKRLFTIFAGLLLGITGAGYLNLGFRIVDVLWTISSTGVGQVALPMLAGLQRDRGRLERAYQKSVELSCVLIYPFFLGIAVTAPEIVETVFGKQWTPASPCVAALACLVLVQAPRQFVNSVLTAVGRPRDPLIGMIAELLFMLIAIAAVRLPTLQSAIVVWIASECVQLPISAWMVRRAVGYGIVSQFAGARTPLAAVLAMAVAIVTARGLLPADLGAPLRLVSLVLVGAPVYIAAIWLLDRKLVFAVMGFTQSAFHKANT
ncbi:MAG: oligosaccharide flippase family protein [Rhodospirillales bacterium]